MQANRKEMIQAINMRIFNITLEQKVYDKKPNIHYLRSLKKYLCTIKMCDETVLNEVLLIGARLILEKKVEKPTSSMNNMNQAASQDVSFDDLEGAAAEVENE